MMKYLSCNTNPYIDNFNDELKKKIIINWCKPKYIIII